MGWSTNLTEYATAASATHILWPSFSISRPLYANAANSGSILAMQQAAYSSPLLDEDTPTSSSPPLDVTPAVDLDLASSVSRCQKRKVCVAPSIIPIGI